ncbi:glutamate receptor 2.9-like [Arachis duranensis]|uniref:Glutamate receptor 2.9-like n=1 Tax=Arachis duranensis TaxID=130453 RepID=A0A6P4BY61_ARADU|nr:glutamate receptor 2.9-like [Arachis duranensis]
MVTKNNVRKLLGFVYSMNLVVLLGVAAVAEREVKVGAVLDVGVGMVGKMGLNSIRMCIHDFYVSNPHYKTRLQLILRDSQRNVVTAAAQALDLIKNEQVEAVIGPVTTTEAMFVINLGDKAHVPIVTFSATSPSLSSLHTPYFFQIAQKDSTQVEAITAIIQAFRWKEVVPIYVNNSYGEGLIPWLTNSLQKAYIRVPYLSAIDFSATDDAIEKELYNLMTMQTRVFVVHMTPFLGSRLFAIAKTIGMMDQGYVWIVTDGMANFFNSLDSSVMDSMEGVLGVRPYIPRTKQFLDFRARWKRQFLRDNPTLVDINLNAFGIWAYDATTALAMAVEKLDSTLSGFTNVSKNSSNVTDLENFGVSRNGEKLREALSNVRFKGVGGDFKLVGGGELQASAFEIVNVIGNGEKNIGFWMPEKGLIRSMDSKTATTAHSSSKENLGRIIWPGDSYSIPKGWQIPTNGKKLMIGVPVKDSGYSEFVRIIHDPITNSTKVTGFCIDVFNAVVEALPYALSFDLIPFENSNGEMAGTYDDLVNQVYYGKSDGVVGDTTITANRSNYVDFTLPYTESGVTMVVPIRDSRKKNAWAFLKPLTWDLWVTTFCSFVFIGFVVWVLEHRINNHFRGPPSYQIGTSLWFSFSTMVFSHRERVASNCGRFVVIVWVFVVQILVQSYTASLTSLLTVEQLRPVITDVHQLLKNRLNVGYLDGSFVREILKDLGFQESQLKIYRSAEECNDLFTKGTANGGIDAAFDEVPYVTHLLQIYCSKYTMIEPRFKTGGFGFVFPKGSPLVADISRAILNVTQGAKMKTIENAWLNGSSCPGSNAQISSASLGLESFWGLFLVIGVSCALALMFFLATFLYQYRHILSSHQPSTSIWTRIGTLLSIFNEKDLSSHTFKKSAKQDASVASSPAHHHGIGSAEASPSTHCPSSPYSYTESNFSFYGDQVMFSPDRHGDGTHQGHETQDREMRVVHDDTQEVATTNSNNTNSQAT